MPRGDVVTVDNEKYRLEVCPDCGMMYLLPEMLVQQAFRVRDRDTNNINAPSKTFHCPDGHTWHYKNQARVDQDAVAKKAAPPAPPSLRETLEKAGVVEEPGIVDAVLEKEA